MTSGGYRYGFNGKENDNEVKGEGNEQDYGMRIYDPRLGKFLSVDPLTYTYPYYTPYQFAGNSPIKFIDLDGAERVDNATIFWRFTPFIDMTNATGTKVNAAGFPRNGPWFWRQMLKEHPEMFSARNVEAIKNSVSPIADQQWITYNPEHENYLNDKLIHHHIEQGKDAAGIPEKVHREYFEELHPNLPGPGSRVTSTVNAGLGTTVAVLGPIGDIASFLNGNPESIIAMFPCIGCDPGDFVGKIQKDRSSGAYYTISNVVETFVNNKLNTKTITYNVYSGFEWDDKAKKYVGTGQVGTKKETWYYDEKGNRTTLDKLML